MSDDAVDGGRKVRSMTRSNIAWPKNHAGAQRVSEATQEAALARLEPLQLEPARRAVRALYLFALVQLLIPIGVTALSTFPALMTPRITGAVFASVLSIGLPSLLALMAVVWRDMDVLRGRSQLAAPPALGVLHWVRQIAILLMLIGVAMTVLTWFSGPLVRALVPTRTDSGVELLMARMWLGGFTFWAPAGLLMFELGRLLGFERETRAD